MKKENDEFLVNKFPKIFADRFGDMKTTAMCWGFDCGDGWFGIIHDLCESIQFHIDYNSKKERIKNRFVRWLSDKEFYLSRKVLRGRTRYLVNEWSRKFFNKFEKEEYELFPQVVATQVKEKYGGLCFYYYGGDRHIGGMVSFAESMSYKTCDVCGTNQNVGQTRGWVVTICEDCLNGKSKDDNPKPLWEKNKLSPTMEKIY